MLAGQVVYVGLVEESVTLSQRSTYFFLPLAAGFDFLAGGTAGDTLNEREEGFITDGGTDDNGEDKDAATWKIYS